MTYIPTANIAFDLGPADAPADPAGAYCRRCGVDVESGHRPGCPREERVKACGCVGVVGQDAYDIHEER